MGNTRLKMTTLMTLFYLFSFLIVYAVSEKEARLEILPVQSVQRKPVGKSLMLTCRPDVPDANLVSDLQWKDNQNLTILPKPAGHVQPKMYTETLPGDQSLALLIPSLTETMAGTYYCTASYAISQPLSISVKIETYVAITWKDAPRNQFPILGSDYVVRCEVIASPAPTVDWLRNGDPIKSGERYAIETRGLLIRNVQESDDGVYTCRAAVVETGELDDRDINVEVYIKPIISKLPRELEAIEGHEFATYCNATGKPVPSFEWIKDQTQKNVATSDRFLVNPQTGLLTITKVEQEDYGTYTCRATNDAGFSKSSTKLNVLVKPKIFELFNITTAAMKETAITCRATGRPAPEITFRRWGTTEEYVNGLQPGDDRIILEQHRNHDEGVASGTLRISKLLRSDDGLYQCIARNKGAEAFRSGHITVEFPPNFDYMRTLPPVYTWQEKIANLSCLAMSIPNATIEWRWKGRLIQELHDPNLVIEGKGPRSDLLVRPISSQYYSAYKCLANNIHGHNEIDIELKEARIPDQILPGTPRVVTATTMTFDIIGPQALPGLPITGYTVQYKDRDQLDWTVSQNRTWSPDSPYIVEGLRPTTSYDFRFAASNKVGIGQWSAVRTQSTPKRSAPEEPRTLHAPAIPDEEDPIIVSPYSDHFELRWSVPADNGEPIDYYHVKYCPGMKSNGKWSELETECVTRDIVEATTYEMSHLSGNTYYRIELRAHNSIGYSTASSIIMKTALDNPYNSSSTCTINVWLIIILLLASTYISTIITSTTTQPTTVSNLLTTTGFHIVSSTFTPMTTTNDVKKISTILTSSTIPSTTQTSTISIINQFNSNQKRTNSKDIFGSRKRKLMKNLNHKLRTDENSCENDFQINRNFINNLQQH